MRRASSSRGATRPNTVCPTAEERRHGACDDAQMWRGCTPGWRGAKSCSSRTAAPRARRSPTCGTGFGTHRIVQKGRSDKGKGEAAVRMWAAGFQPLGCTAEERSPPTSAPSFSSLPTFRLDCLTLDWPVIICGLPFDKMDTMWSGWLEQGEGTSPCILE